MLAPLKSQNVLNVKGKKTSPIVVCKNASMESKDYWDTTEEHSVGMCARGVRIIQI